MKVVFLSNYFTHHQKPLSDALAVLVEYTFIETAAMDQERLALGWGIHEKPDYVCHYGLHREKAEALLRQADAVITGSAPEQLVQECIRRNQLVLRYSERPLKKGMQWHKYLPRLIKWHLQNPVRKPIYLLCASGFTATDYAKFGLFRGRAFRWGYFPETRQYDAPDVLVASKTEGSILWAGRFLDWKHPDDALQVAARLKAEGFRFQLNFIGRGPLENQLQQMIRELKLEDCVCLLGSMTPEEVRCRMEQSRIFLFTSDRMEGWGAVLNEAMNSGCAVVASDAIGSVPYLIRESENGCIYPSGDLEAMYQAVRMLLTNPKEQQRMGKNACQTILREWNAECAAERLVSLADRLRRGESVTGMYGSGPCSDAGG